MVRFLALFALVAILSVVLASEIETSDKSYKPHKPHKPHKPYKPTCPCKCFTGYKQVKAEKQCKKKKFLYKCEVKYCEKKYEKGLKCCDGKPVEPTKPPCYFKCKYYEYEYKAKKECYHYYPDYKFTTCGHYKYSCCPSHY